jgi:hypothetical protein
MNNVNLVRYLLESARHNEVMKRQSAHPAERLVRNAQLSES